MTTIDAVNFYSLLYAVKEGVIHVSVCPIGTTMAGCINIRRMVFGMRYCGRNTALRIVRQKSEVTKRGYGETDVE